MTLMFKDIVSALSFSPHAASQLSFYARRLGQEKITRLFSALGAVLIIALQFSAIAAPPADVNAASASDLIYGGYVSRADLLSKYDASVELQRIYGDFGVTRQDIVNAAQVQINSRDHSLNSLGRVDHPNASSVVIPGTSSYQPNGTYYANYLYSFDTGSNVQSGSYYEVLQGTTASGAYFAIMFRCGNIVFHQLPPAPPVATPTPQPTPVPTPTPKPTPVPTPVPGLACLGLSGNLTSGQVPLTVNFTGGASASGQTVTAYNFAYGDNVSESKSTPTASHTYTTPGKFIATLTVKGSLGSTTPVTSLCSFTVTPTSTPAAFTLHKTALNLTQNVDATTTNAKAGDQIQYSLSTTNVGGVAASYTVTEQLEDVLEYADVSDPAGGTLADNILTWPAVTIAPGTTVTKTFVVTVKNPIPDTPVGLSNPFSYDLRMDNVYGNAVEVHVAPPLPKQVETAAAQLPDTGAGTSATIVLVFSAFALFFYFRNRQLAQEIRLLRHDYHGGA